MKSKCSFILKALTAMVLVFLLLFGTVATSLAAVVENAVTAAEADVAETGATTKVYFRNNDNWPQVWILTSTNINASVDSSGCKGDIWGSDLTSATAMTLVPSESNVYEADITLTGNKVVFVRNKSSEAGYLKDCTDCVARFDYASGKIVNAWDSSDNSNKIDERNNTKCWKSNLEDYTPPAATVNTTIYVNKDVTLPYAHIWSNVGDNWTGSWPGENTASASGWNDNGTYYYKTFTNSYSTFNIIMNQGWNEGGDQTVQLTTPVDTGASYYIDSTANGETTAINNGAPAARYTVTFNMNSHGAQVASQTVVSGNPFTEPSPAPTAPGYTFGGWYTINDDWDSAYNWNDDASNITLYAKWTPAATTSLPAGTTFYLESDDTTNFYKGDNNDTTGRPNFYFATSSSGANATAAITGDVSYGLTGNGYYANMPSGQAYTFVRVQSKIDNSIDSGWIPISSVDTNTITYSGGEFTSIGLPTSSDFLFTGGYSNIYFDNTNSNWTINGTNKLYFVLGDGVSADYMVEMSKVTNTQQLYFVASDDDISDAITSGKYKYLYFALSSSSSTANIINKTTKSCMYNVAGTKTFIGETLANNGTIYSLDFLWIRDSAIDGDGLIDSANNDGAPANEGRYLNRKVHFSIGGRATASISGSKATSAGVSGVEAQTAVTRTNNIASDDNTADVYYARSTVVTVSGIKPANGYTVSGVSATIGTGVSQTVLTVTENNGTYTFVLPGGDDRDYSQVNVTVNLTRGHPDVMLLGLWRNGMSKSEADKLWNSDISVNGDRIMTYAASLDADGDGNNDYPDGCYYIDLELDADNYYASWSNNGTGNGFKIYDTDTGVSYGNNYALYTGSTDIGIYSDNPNNVELQNNGGVAGTFRFVYYISSGIHHIHVYYPNNVTYNLKDKKESPTTEVRAVRYGAAAENWTPTRNGYQFVGWCTDAAGNTPYTNAPITSATTLYAKWTTADASFKVNYKIDSAAATGDTTYTQNNSSNINGGNPLMLTASDSDFTGKVFAGWVLSGSAKAHVDIYTDAAYTTHYVSGQTDSPVYILPDGTEGITYDKVTITKLYLTRSALTVNTGTNAGTNLTRVNNSEATASASNYTANFNYDTNVVVTFGNLSAGMGINTVTFADGQAVEYSLYSAHAIQFRMPDHPVTITGLNLNPMTCSVKINNKSKVDVENLAVGGSYATGAKLENITIKGANDYEGSSELTGITAQFVGDTLYTINNNGSQDITFGGYKVHIAVAGGAAVISGNINGNLVLTPILTTKYNLNVTSRVLSDVYAKYTTFYKTQTASTGKAAVPWLANLKAYIWYTGIDVSEIDTAAEAAEAGLAWNDDALVTKSVDVNGDSADETIYLIAEDVDGDYINLFPEGSKIHLEVEDISNGNGGNNLDPYVFVGWYEGDSAGADYEKGFKSDVKAGYTYTLEKSTFIYAVVTRDLYIGGYSYDGSWAGSISWSTAVKMTYDPLDKVYYKEFDVQSGDSHKFEFRIYDLADTGNDDYWGTSNTAVWAAAAHTIDSEAQALYGGTFDWTYAGGDASLRAKFYLSNTDATNVQSTVHNAGEENVYTTYKIRLYYRPATEEIYLIPVYNTTHKTVYLSNGRTDGLTKLGLTVGAATTFTTPASDFSADQTTLTGGTTETFKYYEFESSASLTFTTTLSGANAGDAYVAGYVVYNLDTGEAKTIKPTSASDVYTGTVTVNYNAFICPVYEVTAAYCTSNSIKAFPVEVDSSGIEKTVWGGLVAMYTFGSVANKDYNAAWPGQLMLPEGHTFTGTVYNKISEDVSDVTGIVFDNYNTGSSFIGEFADRFDYPTATQTYDYLEPITLMTQGDDQTLTFALKSNNDGYHGEYYNSNSKNEGPYHLETTGAAQTGAGVSGTHYQTKVGEPYEFYDTSRGDVLHLDDVYTFEYLTNKSGNRMNLYGSEVTSSAGYYIICVGDTDYKYHSTQYDSNAAFSGAGQYSVEWYVYDADFNFLLHTISDSIYHKVNGESYISYLLLSRNLTDAATLNDKAVMICYEAPNTRVTTTRFSGQWYTTSTRTRVTVYAGVGMMDDNDNPIVPEIPNSTMSYGTAAVAIDARAVSAETGLTNGLKWGNLLVSDSKNGYVTLTAAQVDRSTFKGWYSYNSESDAYTKVADTLSYSPTPDVDTRYFAMFLAQATYNFVYTGRNGTKTYSVVAGVSATLAEGANGGILDKSNEDRITDVRAKIAAIPTMTIFNKTIAFSANTANWDNTSPYQITIRATDTLTPYTLTVYAYNGGSSLTTLGTVNGNYNKIIDLTDLEVGDKGEGVSIASMKPSGGSDQVFYGWKKYNGSAYVGDYLSTWSNFGFSLTDSLSIAPVFGPADGRDTALKNDQGSHYWKAFVDKNVVGREMTDASNGKIYNDSIIRFTYSADSATRCTYEDTGVIILAQTKDGLLNHTSIAGLNTEAKLQAYLGALASRPTQSAPMNSKYGEAYAFKVQTTSLSRLNRADICQVLDYAKFDGGQYILAAYYYDGTSYHISNIVSHTYSGYTSSTASYSLW